MEKFKELKHKEQGLTWLELRDLLNTKSEEDLNGLAIVNYIDDVECEVVGFAIDTIMEAEEDHINPSGEGMEPISYYEDEDVSDEIVVLKKGSLIGLLS